MLTFVMFVWTVVCFAAIFITSNETSTVLKVSVSEEHHLYLRCGDSFNVVWTHRVKGHLATRRGEMETNQNRIKYGLLSEGSLRIVDLEASDCGEYLCNGQIVAEVEVLRGRDFTVSVGRTLLLPCSSSSKPKQKWSVRKRGYEQRVHIFTRYKNGTLKKERGDRGNRFTFDQDALQILNLQLGDAGEYMCNGEMEAKVTVRSVSPELSSTTQRTTTAAVVKETDDDMEKEVKRPDKGLMMLVVTGTVVLLTGLLLCVVLMSRMCLRKKNLKSSASSHKSEETELQPCRSLDTDCEMLPNNSKYKGPSVAQNTEVHYASLGRQNWMERPRVLGDQHHVIYSSVLTRPAVR